MNKPEPVLRISQLRVERDLTILDDVNWLVEKGQHWCILGANGSGKTSLLNTLMAYLPASAGTIEVCGQEYGTTDWREHRKKIGLVSSSILQRIEPSETVIETVVSGKYAMLNYWGKISEADRQSGLNILKQIACDHLAERSWRNLSQGEKQRICIGRALMADLRLLFLDEPCAGLDPVARENFLLFLEDIAQKKTLPTLVLVTHHIDEIMPSFTHILLLKSGRVLASGAKEKVLTSDSLSKAFGARITLRKAHADSRYRMTIASQPTAIL
jgi:iron complex transport system ATP-binding protein